MQPTYIPWMGYFGMVDATDIFVFYDDVQFVSRSWQRRNKIKVPQNWIWLTVPVIENFGQNINEVKINNALNWRDKHWKSIQHSYSKAPFFKDYMPVFKEIYDREWEYLVDLNVALIRKITEILGLEPKFLLASELNATGNKTDRLISLLKELGANEYISSPGSKSYIENEKFSKEGITLYWYEFNHPIYPQLFGDFIPYLSVIDLLFNVGSKSLDVIRKGGENALKKA